MARRIWWQVPQLRTDEDEHRDRRASWLELFFDLVFVVVIAELAHHLSEHVTLQGLAEYVLLFIPVWWTWIGGTFYTERFETSDVSYRIFTFLQMLPVAAMAIFAHEGLQYSSAFALSYAASRVIIIFLWLRAGVHAPSFRPVTNRYAVGFSISVLLFIVSVFVPAPFRYALWIVALAIDLLTPIATLKLQARLPRLSTSRLPERFGLFVIIVLGEAIIGVVQGLAEQPDISWSTALVGLLGMALVFGLWWIYFDFIARRSPNFGGWWSLFWNYLHLPLVMSIAAVGAAIQNILLLETEIDKAAVFLLLGGAIASALLTMGLIELSLRRDPQEPTDHRISVSLKLAAGAVALGLGFWGSTLGPIGFLFALLPLLLVQMIYGAYTWFQQELSSEAVMAQD